MKDEVRTREVLEKLVVTDMVPTVPHFEQRGVYVPYQLPGHVTQTAPDIFTDQFPDGERDPRVD
jgi:hypothetical protein